MPSFKEVNMHKKRLFLLILILFPVFLTGMAFLMTSLPLPQPFPTAGSHDRNLQAAILTGILGMAWVISLTIYSISRYLGGGRVLDVLFIPLGLTASNYLGLGRQYQGHMAGREVQIQFTPGRMLKSGLLNIRIQANQDQRMAIGLKRPLLDCRDCPQVDVTGLGLEPNRVYAANADWAQKFVAEPGKRTLIQRLMQDPEGLGMREVYLQPGWVWLHARPSSNSSLSHIENWFQTLMELASASGKAD
jgi:hypothetical protein